MSSKKSPACGGPASENMKITLKLPLKKIDKCWWPPLYRNLVNRFEDIEFTSCLRYILDEYFI